MTTKTSRAKAQSAQRKLLAGQIVYSGRARFCLRGHDTWKGGRYASSSSCRTCSDELSARRRITHFSYLKKIKNRWYRNNPKKQKESMRKWRERNRLYDSLRGSHRRALIRSADLREEDMAEVVAYYGDECVYCGNPMTGFDHLHPLSRGGLHVVENLAPACFSCNSRKQDRSIWFMIGPSMEMRVRPSSVYVLGR